jgi:DNA-binding LytR/AlgR family response regulator
MKMNCLIIEDEPMARKGLEEYVDEIDFLQRVASCENALKASRFMNEQQIDLIFLDIHMPKLSGIEFLKTLKNPPLTIFTTAYTEHAIEGYSLDVIDYLVKPITFDRFLKASRKALDFFQLKSKAVSGASEPTDYFFVRCDNKFEKVFFQDVSFIESLQNYAVIHVPGRKLITYLTLSGLENQLPGDRFIKVHKSYIVSVRHIRAIEGSEILINGDRIPISRGLRDEVIRQIMGNRLFKR